MAHSIELSWRTKILRSHQVHITFPTQRFSIHHAAVWNVCQWNTVHLAFTAQQVLWNDRSNHGKETHTTSDQPEQPKTSLGSVQCLSIRMWSMLQSRRRLENHAPSRVYVQKIHQHATLILHVWAWNIGRNWGTQEMGWRFARIARNLSSDRPWSPQIIHAQITRRTMPDLLVAMANKIRHQIHTHTWQNQSQRRHHVLHIRKPQQ